MECKECPIIHRVFRIADGKCIGEIVAVWESDGSGGFFADGVPHGGILRRHYRFSGRVSRGILDAFAGSILSDAAERAFEKYRFEPSPY